MTTKKLILCSLFCVFIIIGTFLKIPFLFVPVTLQTLFIVLSGFVLGKIYGPISVALYIFLGLMGFPVFTAGGGLGYIVYPTFGYMLGGIAASFIAGFLCEKDKKRNTKTIFIIAIISFLSVYIIGVPYFYLINKYVLNVIISLKTLFLSCFLYTFFADFVKAILVTYIIKSLKNKITF